MLHLITPELLVAFAAMAAAFCLGAFTFFMQAGNFMRSLDFYIGPGYRDPVASNLPLTQKLTSLLTFYLAKMAWSWFTPLLIAGATVILVHPVWRRRLWPYLAIAAGFFLTRSLDLQRAPHHIALWVPFYAIVVAAAPAALIDAVERRLPQRRHLIHAIAFVLVVAAAFLIEDHAVNGRQDMLSGVDRLQNVEYAYQWMHAGLPAKSDVYSAFYCFGPDTHYGWLRSMGVTVPEQLGTDHTYHVWWWNRSALQGHAGYACLAPVTDLPSLQRVAKQPGEAVFPSEDPAFHTVKTFGQGPTRIEIYQFDLR